MSVVQAILGHRQLDMQQEQASKQRILALLQSLGGNLSSGLGSMGDTLKNTKQREDVQEHQVFMEKLRQAHERAMQRERLNASMEQLQANIGYKQRAAQDSLAMKMRALASIDAYRKARVAQGDRKIDLDTSKFHWTTQKPFITAQLNMQRDAAARTAKYQHDFAMLTQKHAHDQERWAAETAKLHAEYGRREELETTKAYLKAAIESMKHGYRIQAQEHRQMAEKALSPGFLRAAYELGDDDAVKMVQDYIKEALREQGDEGLSDEELSQLISAMLGSWGD